jgi:hypothetical protein
MTTVQIVFWVLSIGAVAILVGFLFATWAQLFRYLRAGTAAFERYAEQPDPPVPHPPTAPNDPYSGWDRR